MWAALVALGVAVVSMTVFGARFTRTESEDPTGDFDSATDPADPWAAWKPRPFEELERRPRPRLWPILAALTGLVMIGAGFAGARQNLWTQSATASAPDPTPHPLVVEVEAAQSKATPVPTPTPKPTPHRVVAAPKAAAAKPSTAPTSAGPLLSGSASCGSGRLRINVTATARGSSLSWMAIYVDGKVAKGGPISGQQHTTTYETSGSPGTHALEASVQDKAGKTTRKQFQVRCG